MGNGRDSASVLRFDAVSYVRQERPILKEIGWDVRRGERWVVVGPNGAGKTSLVTIASTYDSASAGQTEVLGQRIGTVDVRELRKRIGLLSTALRAVVPPRTRAGDLVVMGQDAKLRRWHDEYTPEEEQRALDLLALFGCGHLSHCEFRDLSEGERQRVQIARTQMADPDLLLLDEPAAGLDVVGRELVIASLGRLAAQTRPAGIVLVTHHLEEVPPGFTHALLLRDGEVTAAGPIEQTLTSEELSRCFDAPLRVGRVGDRFTVHWNG